jgi:hypothetical protein
MPSVFTLNVIMLSVFTLIVTITPIMLSVVVLNVIVLNVVAPPEGSCFSIKNVVVVTAVNINDSLSLQTMSCVVPWLYAFSPKTI